MENAIEQFIQERKYLHNVTPATIQWYRSSFKAFEGATDTLESAKKRIVELRERGLSPVSVNVHLRCINAFWRWQGRDWKVPRLKEEQKILQTLSESHIRALIGYKPDGTNLRRAHVLALTILDTGLRASEALSLTVEEVDFDNLTMKVVGKGCKHRLVPFSAELRKALWKYLVKKDEDIRDVKSLRYVFGTHNNTKLSVRNFERDLKMLGQKLGITGVRFSPHTLRHSFATNFLRHSGDIYSLSRILGHNSIKTTEIYLRSIGIDDLKRVHSKVSILSRQ